MKYFEKSKMYKNSTGSLTYNAETHRAYSYDWYIIAKNSHLGVVLNTYNYSKTTRKHVQELRNLFRSLNLKFIEIEAPNGLQNLNKAIEHYQNLIKKEEALIARPKSKKEKNKEREINISFYKLVISLINSLNANKLYSA